MVSEAFRGIDLIIYILKLIGTKLAGFKIWHCTVQHITILKRMSFFPEHAVILQDEVDDALPGPADLAAVGEVPRGELDED